MRTLLILLASLFSACSIQYVPSTTMPLGLEPLIGDWVGTLTYTDYRDDASRASLPVRATATSVQDPVHDESALLFDVTYTEPDGSSGGSSRSLFTPLVDRPDQFGYDTEIWQIVESRVLEDEFEITIEQVQEDNDRPATIRQVLSYDDGVVSVQKLVRYDGTDDFFERNILEMVRR